MNKELGIYDTIHTIQLCKTNWNMTQMFQQIVVYVNGMEVYVSFEFPKTADMALV